MKKVCMLVWNDMRHDARVSKEAGSLADAGYAVTVLALHNQGLTEKHEKHPRGFQISRVSRYLVPGLDGRFFEYLKKKRLEKGEQIHSLKSPQGVLKVLYLLMMRIAAHLKLFLKAFFINADIYHAHDINVLPTLWLCAKLRRKPIIYDAHEISTSREGYQKIAKLVYVVENFLCKRVNGMITTTDMRADIFVKDYGCERPVVLQNRPMWFRPEKTDKLRLMFGISSGTPIVLYQGGMQRGRGLHNIIKSAEKTKDCVYVMIGSGALKASLQKMTEELDLTDRVYFIDAVPLEELYELTASADIGIQVIQNTCLNHYSTDSNKLFEYIMCGLPVIASDFPEIRKIVNSTQTGLLVDSENLDDIISKIKRLVCDSELRGSMSANCLATSQELSWETQEAELIDLYRAVCKD